MDGGIAVSRPIVTLGIMFARQTQAASQKEQDAGSFRRYSVDTVSKRES